MVDQRFLGDEEFNEEMRERQSEPETKPPVDIDLKEIVGAVCREFGIRAERVGQREKSREVSRLRWIIGKLAVEEGGYRMVEMARFFGRDPGVMSRGLRQLEEQLAKESEASCKGSLHGCRQGFVRDGR